MAMTTTTVRMSVEEYLQTSFQPDAEFTDGVFEERNVGEFDHARLQGVIYALLAQYEEDWNVYVSPELRVRVSAERYRVPDLCVTDAREAVEQSPPRDANLHSSR